MYVHCTYGYVRTLYVRTRTSKKLSFRMLSVLNPYVRACTYNVRTFTYICPLGCVDDVFSFTAIVSFLYLFSCLVLFVIFFWCFVVAFLFMIECC